MKKIFFLTLAICMIILIQKSEAEQMSIPIIERGKKVSIEYRLRLADGTVVDSNVGKAPLTYIQGAQQIIPGLERQLEGMKQGEAKKIEVSIKEGYGEYKSSLIQEIPKNSINSADLSVGAKLYSQDNYGRMVTAVIKEIKKDTLVIDMNHPLAGKNLYFDVKVIKIENAK
ncbi:MAG: peptidylprolyl isomerase [Candidatus Omnitrophota bacterium]|nr:peptidylprolyl isomerase [Candidatus Omnitrophota bacterium]